MGARRDRPPVEITCERFGFCDQITGLTPGGPVLNSGKLAVGDLIETVDDEYLASLSLDELDQRLKGQPERECCLLVLESVTFTPQRIRQPEAAW